MSVTLPALGNGSSLLLTAIPVLSPDAFFSLLQHRLEKGASLCAYFGLPAGRLLEASPEEVPLFALLADDVGGQLSAVSTRVHSRFPSLTPMVPQVHWFEREIFEQCDVVPDNHPFLKPLRFTHPEGSIGKADFFELSGEEVHEVAVGPVHAGVIEPGHFRFQCHGEVVHHLEISLGYQHRGIEAALVREPVSRHLHYMETAAGDTTIGHALCYAELLETLQGISVPPRAMLLRAIALELERLANHTGDLGALAGDVGFLPTASYCGRLRGDFLNMSALLCGNRFGRGLVRVGGVGLDADEARLSELHGRLERAEKEVLNATDLLFNSASCMARFEGTGLLTEESARTLGLVGPAARASALRRDTRCDFPSGYYCYEQIPLCTADSGDVFARALVRRLEIEQSLAFLKRVVRSLPKGSCRTVQATPLLPSHLGVALCEGWRGRICHVGITDGKGDLLHYKMIDPSFQNWFGLAYCLCGQAISDFPLCNKSFNLSYCGHDL